MSSTTGNLDPYLHPDGAVLRNLRCRTDPEQLERFEARRSHLRIAELIAAPLAGAFDVGHLKAIHRYIFRDVYAWAGEFRTVNISKGGHLFGAAAFLEQALGQVFGRLSDENFLARLDSGEFAERAAYYLGEVNAAHPFREGNGRTQREFIRELGLRAGHYLDWRATSPARMIEASRVSHISGRTSLLLDVIRACMVG